MSDFDSKFEIRLNPSAPNRYVFLGIAEHDQDMREVNPEDGSAQNAPENYIQRVHFALLARQEDITDKDIAVYILDDRELRDLMREHDKNEDRQDVVANIKAFKDGIKALSDLQVPQFVI